jgi:hypothetical protein
LVLFEWHALDHIPLSASYESAKSSVGWYDPYHLNSISLDRDGNLIFSMRNTSAIYLIDHRTGRIIWTLGGKRSSFKMGSGTRTWEQHDAVLQPDGTLTAFDNGGGPPFVHRQSRGIREALNTTRMTAALVREYDHVPAVASAVEGGVQMLADGDAFIGWGVQRFFSEYSPTGEQVLDGRFKAPIASYRAYRFEWNGQPASVPAVAVSSGPRGAAVIYASWNGATAVAFWRVLAGAVTRRLRFIAQARKAGFETAIPVRARVRYFAVQALGSRGEILATSRAVATRPPRHARRPRRHREVDHPRRLRDARTRMRRSRPSRPARAAHRSRSGVR